MYNLPRPEVVRCFFENGVQPPLPVMELRWDADDAVTAESVWHLPAGVALNGPAPTCFGVTIYRHAADAYQVRVVWNGLFLGWENLTRVQIMASALVPVLASLGTDLWYLLTQPAPAQVA